MTSTIYKSQCHIIAYLQYYFFLNYPAIKWILLKNLENGTEIIPRKDIIKILDYGAGPGTASMAVCDFLEDAKDTKFYENTRIKLHFDEKEGFFSECYRKMLSKHEMVESIKYVGEVGYRENSYDIIIISYALSEMDGRMQKWLISNIICKCLRNGRFVGVLK
jgi:ribosomal protein RSM22 (predicted rRNA methylase)